MQGGASVETRVLGGDGRESMWLCAGSTALHLASARGSVAIALALLEAQASRPGERLNPRPIFHPTLTPTLTLNSDWTPALLSSDSATQPTIQQHVTRMHISGATPCYKISAIDHMPAAGIDMWRNILASCAGITDLRRIRNSRGLRASTIARAEGHHELARLLHDMRPRRGAHERYRQPR